MSDAPTQHAAHLGSGNGVVAFVCCRRTENPWDITWNSPGGRRAANIFHFPRQAFEEVVTHLTRATADSAEVQQAISAARNLITEDEDVRPAIRHLIEHLDYATLEERD